VSDTATPEERQSVPGLTDATIALPEGKSMASTDSDSAVIVLVVEDETLVRLLANDILTEAGYRVLEAHDGQEALAILGVHKNVRALFTDVTMPNIDGLSLARIVSERWPEIGIVITSGVPLPSEPPPGARFVPKPFSPKAVLRALETVIAETAIDTSAAPSVLTSTPMLRAGQMHGAGGLAQPLAEPED
jgi:CheY-like chemotaxis protein